MPHAEGRLNDPGHHPIREVARACGVHPQTPRLYERAGLIKPSRSSGNTRRYSRDDIERLGTILGLTRDGGVNLAGVEIILRLRGRVADLEARMAKMRGQQRVSGSS